MGLHSGYDRLFTALEQKLNNSISLHRYEHERYGYFHLKLLKYLDRRVKSTPQHSLTSTGAEWKAFLKMLTQRPQLLHLGYVENHYAVLRKLKKYTRTRYVATLHQPAGWWRLRLRPSLTRSILYNLDALIVLSRKDVGYFEQFLPGKVHFIPHGVDTVFFRPEKKEVNKAFRCVFSGQWLRDVETLILVVERVVRLKPTIQFDIIYPMRHRLEGPLLRLARHEQVHWHSSLSDEDLRDVYQRADVLLLPLIDCTANNALLEAMSCGLAVVTTDIGGMRDYVDDTFADLCPPEAVEQLAQCILALAQDPAACARRGEGARAFAEQNLSWEVVANRVLNLYNEVLQNNM